VRIEFIAAADMGVADENLRRGRAGAGAVVHLLAIGGISRYAQLGEGDFFARQ
jgi:hypothetical protein